MGSQQKPETAEVATATVPIRSLFDRVSDYLDTHEWRYTAEPEKGYFDLHAGIKGAIARVILDTYESEDWQRLLVYSVYPVYVPDARHPAVLDALNRINHASVYGNFELDSKDGELRVRTVAEAEDLLRDGLIERALHSNLNSAGRYFAPLMAVIFGSANPATILDLVTKENDATLQ
jgi:hypothetical protein